MQGRRGVARRGVGFGLFIVIVLSTLLGLTTQVVTTHAAEKASWIDVLRVEMKGSGDSYNIFIDGKLDGDFTFTWLEDPDKCPDTIHVDGYSSKTGDYTKKRMDPIYGCQDDDAVDIIMSDLSGAGRNVAFVWVDRNKINRVDGSKHYTYDTKANAYIENEKNCKDTISISTVTQLTGKLVVRMPYLSYVGPDSQKGDKLQGQYGNYPFKGKIEYDQETNGCWESKPVTVSIASAGNYNITGEEATKPTDGNTTDSTTTSSDESEDIVAQDCQIQGTLGWILNPICDIAVQSTTNLGNYIIDNLRVEPLAQTGGGEMNGVYETWKVFRDLANALLVLVFLIAIFAQVLPLEIDAYTVKKTLPKLIAAAIAIQFSFFICQILVDISNVLGGGVTSLIQGVIGRLPAIPRSDSATNFASHMFVGITGLTIAALFIAPVVMLLVAGIIAILTMLITIQARQVVLIFLAIGSPLAILAWVLPNTEQYAKKWGQNYVKLLLMYPLIAFILAGAELAYVVMSNAMGASPDTTNLTSVQQVMINFIPVIAFFMIPATFKASGAIMGAIANAGFARASRAKARSGAALKSGYVEPLKSGAKNLSKTTGVKMLGSDKRLARTAGRALTGNMFSFGASGRRKIANDVKALKHERLEAQEATVKGMNASNEVIGEMISAKLDGKDSYTYTDRAGETKTVKLTDDIVQGGLRYLNENGGQIELAKIGNGTMAYKDAAGNKVGAGGAAYNTRTNKFNKVGKFAMGEIFKEATDGNPGAVLKAAPHLVHGKGAAVYAEASGDTFAGMKGASMDVAREVIVGNNKAEANFADALVDIMNSSTKSGGMDKGAAATMKEMIETTSVGNQLIDLKDGNGAVPLNTVVDKIFTAGGKVGYNDQASRII